MTRTKYTLPGLTRIPAGQWGKVLAHFVERATSWKAYFPNDSFLGAGKDDFLRLPGIATAPWSGMKECLQVTGSMTTAAKALIMRQAAPDADPLWEYQLLDSDGLLLHVDDFSDCIVSVSSEEMMALGEAGVDVRLLEPLITPAGNIQAVPMVEEDVADLAEAFKDTFEKKSEDKS